MQGLPPIEPDRVGDPDYLQGWLLLAAFVVGLYILKRVSDAIIGIVEKTFDRGAVAQERMATAVEQIVKHEAVEQQILESLTTGQNRQGELIVQILGIGKDWERSGARAG